MERYRSGLRGLGLLALVCLTGCFSTALNRTARTLEPGEADVSYTFSATRLASSDVTTTAEDGQKITTEGESIVWPSLIPEVNFHLGLMDDFEFGGRIALGSLMLELDVKYRFLGDKDSRLHLAVQPALGYRSFFFIEGVHATLPVILTYDLAPNISVNVAPFATYTNFDLTDDDFEVALDLNGVSAGGGIGIQFRGETFHIMPALEFSRTVLSAESDGESADADYTFINFGITFGFIYGREKKQLDRLEKKLDRMDEKLDKLGEKPAPEPVVPPAEAPAETP